MDLVPDIRIRQARDEDPRSEGSFVLYWMIASRRGEWNFSLQRAVEWAKQLKKPLVILEALRCDYPWASDRLHHFIIQGMADNAAHFARKPVLYFPYIEPEQGDGKGLLKSLAEQACVVISDDFPCFFLPRMIKAAARQIPCRFELVDSNGVLPMRATDKVYLRAFDFRRYMQKHLRTYLDEFPEPDPLARSGLPRLKQLPKQIRSRWPMADLKSIAGDAKALHAFPIDHDVPVTETSGGSRAGQKAMHHFLDEHLPDYADSRNQPEQERTSGLSPYLHFGHVSAHEVFTETIVRAEWSPNKLAEKANGSSSGWWGTSESVESFLDQLITWRELGYNFCSKRDDYAEYDSLPDWAQKTLDEHASDERPHRYSLEEFESAETHDELWNAAQRQLLREGKMHNYMRMLWGKKILEWTKSPREALDVMLELNNKYALDGRNPNSYSGIFWVLGRFDRAWGPERPVFGKIRYMSSENTARKLRVGGYLEKYVAEDA